MPTARLTVLQLLQSAGILLVVQIEGELHKEVKGELQKSHNSICNLSVMPRRSKQGGNGASISDVLDISCADLYIDIRP